jgi:hypothetical protein
MAVALVIALIVRSSAALAVRLLASTSHSGTCAPAASATAPMGASSARLAPDILVVLVSVALLAVARQVTLLAAVVALVSFFFAIITVGAPVTSTSSLRLCAFSF